MDVEDRNSRVEMGVEIFEKQINYIKIEEFKQVYQSHGIDLTQDSFFVNYLIRTSDLIGQFFKQEDQILPEAVQQYLRITKKNVNVFNHEIDKYIMIHGDLSHLTNEIQRLIKKVNSSNDLKERVQISERLKEIKRKFEVKIQSKEDELFVQKVKKQMKELKIKGSQEKKVVENHVN